MTVDVGSIIQRALSELRAERAKIDRQMSGLEDVLREDGASQTSTGGEAAGTGGDTTSTGAQVKRKRKPMSKAARLAIGKRMKASWARRKAAAKKTRKNRCSSHGLLVRTTSRARSWSPSLQSLIQKRRIVSGTFSGVGVIVPPGASHRRHSYETPSLGQVQASSDCQAAGRR